MDARSSSEHPIVLFDGVCNLCNASVDFIIRRDRRAVFRFAALQSEAGQKLLRDCRLSTEEHRSLVLIEDNRCYTRSDGALRIARKLDGMWPALFVLRALPAFFRDPVYDFVAANRYRWFGKREACRVPTPELLGRFLT